MKKLEIEIWSDVVCPWCYIGKRRFEQALEGFSHRDDVQVTWRSFELDPEASPVPDSTPMAERLAAKYDRSIEQAQGMLKSTTETAATVGLEIHFDKTQRGNTLDAHRLIHFAAERGKGDAMKERLMKAYFTEGQAISDRDTLVKLAGELAFAADEVRAVLASDQFTADVRKDEVEAQAMGIRGVPCFVIDRKYGVSGAQPPDELRAVLEKAWAEAQSSAAT